MNPQEPNPQEPNPQEPQPQNARTWYAQAYRVHDSTSDLAQAFALYRDLIEAHPDSREAAYARVQIENILKTSLTRETILSAHIGILERHFADGGASLIET